VQLPGAIRWVRRRLNIVRGILVTMIGLMPKRFGGCQPTLASFRHALGADSVLLALREIAKDHLQVLPAPVGFAPRSKHTQKHKSDDQQSKGPDPPPANR